MTDRKIRKKLLSSLPLDCGRVFMRYIQTDDAYDMFEYASKEEVCRFLLWSPHLNLTATEGYIEFLQKRYKKGLYADWAIVLKDNEKMIGTCGFANIDTKGKNCEIGYVLSPKYQKCGYMTEAVAEILKLTFCELELEKATLRIIKENEPSIKLAERFGFRPVKTVILNIRDLDREVVYYELTLGEYLNKKEAVG